MCLATARPRNLYTEPVLNRGGRFHKHPIIFFQNGLLNWVLKSSHLRYWLDSPVSSYDHWRPFINTLMNQRTGINDLLSVCQLLRYDFAQCTLADTCMCWMICERRWKRFVYWTARRFAIQHVAFRCAFCFLDLVVAISRSALLSHQYIQVLMLMLLVTLMIIVIIL
jgi:hypothetical protein